MCHAGNLLIVAVVAYIHIIHVSELSYIEQIKNHIVELYLK